MGTPLTILHHGTNLPVFISQKPRTLCQGQLRPPLVPRSDALRDIQLQPHLQQTIAASVFTQAVQNLLHQLQLAFHRPYVVLSKLQKHNRARMDWWQTTLPWTNQQLPSVMFSYECRHDLGFQDGRIRVWALPDFWNCCKHSLWGWKCVDLSRHLLYEC